MASSKPIKVRDNAVAEFSNNLIKEILAGCGKPGTKEARKRKKESEERLQQHHEDVREHEKFYRNQRRRNKRDGASDKSLEGTANLIKEGRGERVAAQVISEQNPSLQMELGFCAGPGFDQVYVSRDANGKITGFLIVEAKSGPNAKLEHTETKGHQMSKRWVKATAKEMLVSGDPSKEVLGEELLEALRSGHPPVRGVAIRSGKHGNAEFLPCPPKHHGIYN